MTQAILVYSGNHWILKKNPQGNRMKIHWILQAAAASCIFIGFICSVIQKIKSGKEHFATTHAIFGLITCVLWLLTIAVGILNAYAVELRHLIKPIVQKIVHGCLGVLSYSLGMLTLFYGINHDSVQQHFSKGWIIVYNVFICIIWVCTIAKPIATLCQRLTNIFKG